MREPVFYYFLIRVRARAHQKRSGAALLKPSNSNALGTPKAVKQLLAGAVRSSIIKTKQQQCSGHTEYVMPLKLLAVQSRKAVVHRWT